jgi:hypothetical protein
MLIHSERLHTGQSLRIANAGVGDQHATAGYAQTTVNSEDPVIRYLPSEFDAELGRHWQLLAPEQVRRGQPEQVRRI